VLARRGLVVLALLSVTAVTQANDDVPGATVSVADGTLTYSAAAPASARYVDMRITYESLPVDPAAEPQIGAKVPPGTSMALYYLVTGVHDVGPGCEPLSEARARCRPEGITRVVVTGDSRRDNSIDVDMSDRTTDAVAPAAVSVTASQFDQDHVHSKDGVHQTLSCNSLAGDHGSIIDADEAPPGCAYPGAFGVSTFTNGLYMNDHGIVQVGVYCRHDYGSEPCIGVVRLAVRGGGPSDGRYRIRNGAVNFNARVKLTPRAQRVVKASKHHVAVIVSTFAGSGIKRAGSEPRCGVVRTGPAREDHTFPCDR
jgi:hypothetical protein